MATPLLPSASSDDAAVAAHPSWMLVARYGKYDSDDRQYFTADPRTAASALTSNGCHVSVALRPAPPPALSRICIRFPRGVRSAYSTVIAAHGDSFLLSVVISYSMRCCMTDDYFLYSAGDRERARLPSLTLLSKPCWLRRSATGLLRRGEAELVVAQLRMPAEAASDGDVVPAPELILFRAGEWRVVRPRVINGNGWEGLLSQRWESTAVVPLGGGRLCWVDKWSSGLLVADVFEETPMLRHVKYPMNGHSYWNWNSHLCIGAGGAVKLVKISANDDSVRIWTLMSDGTAWTGTTGGSTVDDDDGSAEPWALTICGAYARVQLVYPVVKSAAPPAEEGDDHMGANGRKRRAKFHSTRAAKRNNGVALPERLEMD
ncbi:unnamed protein product [Urochloa humidicola]